MQCVSNVHNKVYLEIFSWSPCLLFQGVQVLIDVESYDYFSSHTQDSEGVLVLIQHYRDIPLMRKESFMLSPGFEVRVSIDGHSSKFFKDITFIPVC